MSGAAQSNHLAETLLAKVSPAGEPFSNTRPPPFRRAVRWDWPKQTLLSEDGQTGDCWRCCIAAVLQVPAEMVPHFLRDGRSLCADTQRWLNQRGFILVQIRGGDGTSGFGLPGWGKDASPVLPIIACGPTVRSKKRGAHHAVVMIGEQLVFDPHPWNCGLLWTTEEYLVVPFHQPAEIFEPEPNGLVCDTDRGACVCGAFHVKEAK